MISRCFECPVKRENRENGNCILPFCLIEKLEEMPSQQEVDTALLWESGHTIEQIQAIRGLKSRPQIFKMVGRWRSRKRELGLLV